MGFFGVALEVMTARNDYYLANLKNYGSLFVGEETTVAYGDKGIGTNHTLPTNGYARAYSGVSLDSFIKKITFQTISRKGLQNLGPTIE